MTNEEFIRRVRNCGLKPRTARVWQTLDEQDTYNVRDPASMDDDEKRQFLKELREKLGLDPAQEDDDDKT